MVADLSLVPDWNCWTAARHLLGTEPSAAAGDSVGSDAVADSWVPLGSLLALGPAATSEIPNVSIGSSSALDPAMAPAFAREERAPVAVRGGTDMIPGHVVARKRALVIII